MSDYEDDEFDPAADLDVEVDEEAVSDDEVDLATKDDDDDETTETIEEFVETERQTIREVIVVAPEKRRTSHLLSELEMTEIVSIRASQIAGHNSQNLGDNYDDPIKKAQLELMKGECPLLLEREVRIEYRDGKAIRYVEHWNPNHMTKKVHYDV